MAERLNLDMAIPIESVSLVMDSNVPGEPVDEMDRQRRERLRADSVFSFRSPRSRLPLAP